MCPNLTMLLQREVRKKFEKCARLTMRPERIKDEYGTSSVLETFTVIFNSLALFQVTLLPSPLHSNTKSCGFYFYMCPGGIPSTISSIQSSSSVAMTTTQPSCWSPCLNSSFSAKLLARSILLPNVPLTQTSDHVTPLWGFFRGSP